MRRSFPVAFVLLTVSVTTQASAQGSFQNLDFESARLVPIPNDLYNRVYFDQAFPGWQGYVGAVQQSMALSNNIFLCCSAITVVDQLNPVQRIEGNFSILFHAASAEDTAIAQTGLIPAGARSILFKGDGYGPYVSVTLAGQALAVIPLSGTSDYSVFGADISAFAGQSAELKFTTSASGQFGNLWVLDSIEFSTMPVPEPSTWALLVCAGGFLALWHWRKKVR